MSGARTLTVCGALLVLTLGAVFVLPSSHAGDDPQPKPQVALSSEGGDIEAMRKEIRSLRNDIKKVLSILNRYPQPTPTPSYPYPPNATRIQHGTEDEVQVIPIEFADVHEVQQVVESVARGKKVHVLNESNSLVVVAPPADIKRVMKVVAKIDQPKEQIRVTSHFFEVAVDDLAKIGLDTQAAHVLSGSDSARNAEAIVTAIQESPNSRLLANPVIQAYDRTQALFRAVAEIPVQQLTQTAEGGSIGTTEFREAGITLAVEPRISKNGEIVLGVHPEVSTLKEVVDGQPVIDRRSASTTVKVPNAGTVLLKGLRIPNSRAEAAGGDRQTELLVMIKAEVMTR